jgi:type II secretory ATPase GspE/PulE/Tfp pilus assembly ATPase PilB-like protein/ActR/RegA family two-component response regulator
VIADSDVPTGSPEDVNAGPVIKLTNLVLRDAVVQRASDIHIEPGRGQGIIRFRVDGVLRKYTQMPMPAMIRVASRIKIMSRMDIADRLRPQDGRAQIRVDDEPFDLRISTVPTRDAEKIVIRILRKTTVSSVDALQLPSLERDRLRRVLAAREGVVIVTGPTGSGKTTSLYAAIQELATEEVNVMTVEDPIEYDLAGITQIQVESKRNVTFPGALRAILRQDPDIILVGEIRDLETAQIAMQAANTGHLVLTTLHTNDAVSAIRRLEDLGLDRAAIAASVRAIVAQRLVRDACSCVKSGHEPATCVLCCGSGYYQRRPIAEVLVLTPELEAAITSGATAHVREAIALSDGMRPMRESALEVVRSGMTTLAEIERVLGDRDAGVASEEARSSQPHVLVVDDDIVGRSLAKMLLQRASWRVTEAVDGVDAMEKLGANPDCSLVVLDLSMPRMDGREVLRGVRASLATATLPVVVLTGSEEDGAEVELMDLGADDYLRKPIDAPRFLSRIRAVLRRSGTAV